MSQSLSLLLIALVVVAVTAALPDVVVRIAPTLISQSESLTTSNENDEGPMEILAKRAQFGSRDDLLSGTLILSPDYDLFLCERYYRHIDVEVDEYGNYKNHSTSTLPPYPRPEEDTVISHCNCYCYFKNTFVSIFYSLWAIISLFYAYTEFILPSTNVFSWGY